MLVLMGSGARDGAADRRRTSSTRASGSVWCRCGCTGRFPPSAACRAARRRCARSACWTAPRSPVRSVSRCISTSSRRWPRRTPTASAAGHAAGHAADATACPRRSSRRRWSPACSPNSPASSRGGASPSASTTTSRGTSVDYDPSFDIESPDTVRAVFFGLGSDGTVGANKNTIKILGSEEGLHAQAYFVYDSKKSGSQTESHLRFGPEPIRAPYLVTGAVSLAATSSGSSRRSTCSAGPPLARRCC